MKPTRRKLLKEELPAASEPKRVAKPRTLLEQHLILQHKENLKTLPSESEKIMYKAGQALASIIPAVPVEPAGADGHKAEDVLEALYESIEHGDLYLSMANRIVAELEKPVRERNEQLRQKIIKTP